MNIVNAASKQESELIHTLLNKKFGQIYADAWKIGVNLSLRISDLLSLKYENIDIPGRQIQLIESKTGKNKHIRLNNTAISVIERRLQDSPTDIYLFQVCSNRAKNKPISRVSVSRVFKAAGDSIGLNLNTHSLRKSRGKALYDAGVPIEKIAQVLNHSNTSSTMRYLGITKAEILSTYDEFEL